MAFYEAYGLGWEELHRYVETVLDVSRDDVLETAGGELAQHLVVETALEASFPEDCFPLVHDGEVCLNALRAAAASASPAGRPRPSSRPGDHRNRRRVKEGRLMVPALSPRPARP